MIRTLKKLTPALTALALLTAISGCAERDPNAAAQAGDSSLPAESPELVKVNGWTGIEMDANSAKTNITQTGHYLTDHNICTHKAEGVYDVPTWNKLVTVLNQVATMTPMPTPRCVDSATGSKFYNKGYASLVVSPTVKRPIFEYKNVQVCSTIPDAAVAATLMELIDKTLVLADRAEIRDCPGHEHDNP
jgi:hypothetical protein